MKLNDKVKELTENWTEWANCYSELNKELELKNPNVEKCLELLKKKDKLLTKKDVIFQELQVILNKTSEDLKLKLDRHFGSKL